MNELDTAVNSTPEVITGIAPADKAPSCTRELFLRPPDWRYQTAVDYLQKEKHHITPIIPTDPWAQLAIRALRAFKRVANRDFIGTLWPDIVAAIRLGTTAKSSAITSEIETMLIRGIEPHIAAKADACIPPIIYTAYSKIFFDLSGITAVHSWINDFLFEPEKYKKNTGTLRARLLAYYGDGSGGSHIMGMKAAGTDSLMKQIASTERQKRLFDYMVKTTNMDSETYVAVMESAVKSMTERDFQEHMKDRDEAGSSSLEDLAQHLEQGIRAFSQQELANPNDTGLDFVNQYTAAILRKDTQHGTENITQ